MAARILYTAQARVTGGRIHGRGETSDGSLAVDLRIPSEVGGEGGGTNPEQLFAIGFGSCFENAVQTVARRRKLVVDDVSVESKVMLLPAEERGFKLAVRLDLTLPSVDDADEAIDLVRAAHRVCPYSNATRGNIDVELTVNDNPVDGAS